MSVSNEISSFASAWLRSRPLHLVHRASLVGILLIVVSVPALMDTPRRSLIARYRKAGFRALRNDKPEVAGLYFRRMARLDATDMEGRYGMALTAEKLGNLPLAYRLMQGLAYGESIFPLAHNWLAEQILKNKSGDLSDDEFWQVQRHLETAAGDPAARVQAHALLGSMLLSRGEHHEAVPHLAAVVDSRPELRIPLARAYRAIGKAEQAAFEIERALAHFRAMSLATPGNADCCLLRVQCEIMAGEMEAADRVLRRACVRFPEDNRFPQALQDMHLEACDRELAAGNCAGALSHLNHALKVDASARGVFERFAAIAGSEEEVSEQALQSLRQAAADGRSPAAAHLALGGVMLRRGRMADARAHFEIGLRHNPDSVALLNNLAWCLVRQDAEHAPRALELVNAALERVPLNTVHRAEVLETRAGILIELERWAEAVIDLERALPDLPEKSDAHAMLARACEKLGAADLAETHQQRRKLRTADAANSRRTQ